MGCDSPDDLWFNQKPPVTEINGEENKFALKKKKLKLKKFKTG